MLFHALLYAQIVRIDATKNPPKSPDSPEASICYAEIVRGINKRFDDVSTRCDDENILAVLTLAFHGRTVDAAPTKTPSQGPMNAMQGLDIYAGRLEVVTMHAIGLGRMLAMRGGLGDIEFTGLAAMIS